MLHHARTPADTASFTPLSHLFEGLLFALVELLIFLFPLTKFSLQPLNGLAQGELVSEEDKEATHIRDFQHSDMLL